MAYERVYILHQGTLINPLMGTQLGWSPVRYLGGLLSLLKLTSNPAYEQKAAAK